MISAPAQDQTALVDTVRAAEGALQQSQTLLAAVDSAATDINRAIAGLPAAVADIQNGIDSAASQLQQKDTPQAVALNTARQAAIQAVADAGSDSSADPLGAFTRLTKADADLDRVLENVAELRKAAEQQAQVLEQALFAAQSRVKSVSEFIDTRRGSIGPEARTRLAEAVRHLEAAQAKKDTDPAEATAHANGAASLAAQAQTLANDDIRTAHRAYSPQYSRNSDLGSVIGGIIIGNVLRGGFGGGFGGSDSSWGGGRSPGRPTSYGVRHTRRGEATAVAADGSRSPYAALTHRRRCANSSTTVRKPRRFLGVAAGDTHARAGMEGARSAESREGQGSMRIGPGRHQPGRVAVPRSISAGAASTMVSNLRSEPQSRPQSCDR